MTHATLLENGLVADGTGAEIKSRVAGRTISVAAETLSAETAAALPGLVKTETVGARRLLHTVDSDAALRRMFELSPDVRDVEVASANLEDAFLALTADHLDSAPADH